MVQECGERELLTQWLLEIQERERGERERP